jgi:hypothetical protein
MVGQFRAANREIASAIFPSRRRIGWNGIRETWHFARSRSAHRIPMCLGKPRFFAGEAVLYARRPREGELMTNQTLYRILMPDGRFSHDAFRVPLEQPSHARSGCVVAINDHDGTQLTVHRARLFPLPLGEPRKACLKCGRVPGVVQDQVKCPYDEGDRCELIEAPGGFPSTQVCAEHSS